MKKVRDKHGQFATETEGVGAALGLDAVTEETDRVSATANVEKCVTTNVQTHCPFCTDPAQGESSSGAAAASPALSSDTANPCVASVKRNRNKSVTCNRYLHVCRRIDARSNGYINCKGESNTAAARVDNGVGAD